MSNRTEILDDRLYNYMLSISLRESEILKGIRDDTAKLPNSNMQISPEQGQFLSWLVKLVNAKYIIEIGTFTGYSAMSMAEALPESGVITACELNKEYAAKAREYFERANIEHKLEIKLGYARDSLKALLTQNKRYDIAFIDADKTNYHTYYQLCLELVKKGGLIIFDNVFWSGKAINPSKDDKDSHAIHEFNKFLYGDKRVDLITLALADGVSIVRIL